MGNLKRYRMVRDQISEEIYGEQDFGGEWVKFSDIKDILKTPTNTPSKPCEHEFVERYACKKCGGVLTAHFG